MFAYRNSKNLLLIGASLGIILTFSACVNTKYSAYSGSAVLIGQGGASHNVNGIDFWVYGTPNRPYQLIGYIEDSRPGGPISMAGREKGIAAQAQAAGADGIIINSDSKEFMGTVSNGFVNGWSTGTGFGMSGFGTTVPVIRRNSTFLAIKYINNPRPALKSNGRKTTA
jgi:hypothetical protein